MGAGASKANLEKEIEEITQKLKPLEDKVTSLQKELEKKKN